MAPRLTDKGGYGWETVAVRPCCQVIGAVFALLPRARYNVRYVF